MEKSEIYPSIAPDHRPIYISLSWTNEKSRGPGLWKFNNALPNISNTRKSVSSDIQALRSRSKKRGAADFFKRLRGVWISDETHFRVFDMASQMINNSWRNSRLELAKFYGKIYGKSLKFRHKVSD